VTTPEGISAFVVESLRRILIFVLLKLIIVASIAVSPTIKTVPHEGVLDNPCGISSSPLASVFVAKVPPLLVI
jgi:hypothetical protein